MSENKINVRQLKQNLHNQTEDIVIETMEDLISKLEFENICTCPQCQLDIATYALNHLPAKYIATHRGNVLTKIENFKQQVNVDIISIVTKAIKIVSENPHQDK